MLTLTREYFIAFNTKQEGRNFRGNYVNLVKKDLPCEICGAYKQLEYHHINPSEKIGRPYQIARTNTWDAVYNEIAKCKLICTECHDKIHNNSPKSRLLQ